MALEEDCCLEDFTKNHLGRSHIDGDGCPCVPGLGELPSLSLEDDRT